MCHPNPAVFGAVCDVHLARSRYLLLELGYDATPETVSNWIIYLFAPHNYVALCIARALRTIGHGKWYRIGTENSGRFVRALGWVQFLADCASVWALYLLLADSDPTQYSALALGYCLTTGAQLVASATLAYHYWTQTHFSHVFGRGGVPDRCSLDRVVSLAQCSVCTMLTCAAVFLLMVVMPYNLFFGGDLLQEHLPGLNT